MVTREQLDRMKNGCIVCNMGHSNTEIDVVIHLCYAMCVSVYVRVRISVRIFLFTFSRFAHTVKCKLQ